MRGRGLAIPGPGPGDHGVEARLGVRRVGDGSSGAVGLQEGVSARHSVAGALLPVRLAVARARVVHAVPEIVFGRALKFAIVEILKLFHDIRFTVQAVLISG